MKSFLSPSRTSTTLPEAEPVELSKNFVVRSLRRRLWKACQEDDAICAMAIYKATQYELEGWLHQEYEARQFATSSAAPGKMKAKDSVESQNGHKVRTTMDFIGKSFHELQSPGASSEINLQHLIVFDAIVVLLTNLGEAKLLSEA